MGVSPDATENEIKQAYRRLAKKYHPDLNPGDPEAARKMNEINAAYEQITLPYGYSEEQAIPNSPGYPDAAFNGNTHTGSRCSRAADALEALPDEAGTAS